MPEETPVGLLLLWGCARTHGAWCHGPHLTPAVHTLDVAAAVAVAVASAAAAAAAAAAGIFLGEAATQYGVPAIVLQALAFVLSGYYASGGELGIGFAATPLLPLPHAFMIPL